ncbi:MAG: hypothetical protein QGI93_13960, partial [Planctomycetota bacterium]|nr:hypothetical protein [Planctomycetota bacterium]
AIPAHSVGEDVLDVPSDRVDGSTIRNPTVLHTPRMRAVGVPGRPTPAPGRAGRWRKQLATTLAAKGDEAQDFFAFYTTCPRCA